MKFLKIFFLFLALSSAALAQDEVGRKPLIITSINPLYQILLAITKDKNNSVLIINPNLSEHNYQLKKSDVESFSKADLIFYIDDELEKNFPKLIKNFSAEQKSYKASEIKGIKLLQRRDNEKKLDVHLWMNPQNSIKIAEFMAQKICNIDNKNCRTYQKNFQKFEEEILIAEGLVRKKMFRVRAAKYVFYHDGYQYFENYFALKPLKVIARDDRELSVKEVRDLDLLTKAGGIKCILGDVHDERNSAQRLAQKYRVRVVALNLNGEMDVGYAGLLLKTADAIVRCSDGSF